MYFITFMLSLSEVTLICENCQKYAHFESLICEKIWHLEALLCSYYTLIITLVQASCKHEHCIIIGSTVRVQLEIDNSKIPWVATEHNLDTLCIRQKFFLDIDT